MFGSFTAMALYSKRRSMLFVGGIISSTLSAMFWYSLIGWFSGYQTVNLAYLFVSLFVSCLYVIYDTQIMIEKAERGDRDVVKHSLELFIDLFDMFIRIVEILMKLQEDDKDKKKKKRED